MIDAQTVRHAAESVISDYGWGYGSHDLTIDGVDYPIEWVEVTDPYQVPGDGDYTTSPLKAVFRVNLEGYERFFCKEGMYRSHYGTEWDGRFYECTPVEVNRVEFRPGTTVVPLTAREVESAFDDQFDGDWGEWVYSGPGKVFEPLEINERQYAVEILETEDGGDQEWSYDEWVVFKVGGQTFKKSGHFQSHYGTEWDGPLKEVKQVEKTVTVWEEA